MAFALNVSTKFYNVNDENIQQKFGENDALRAGNFNKDNSKTKLFNDKTKDIQQVLLR